MNEGLLHYNPLNQRFYIQDGARLNEELHCGDTLEVFVNDEWIPTRIECERENNTPQWYLIDTDIRNNMEGKTVRKAPGIPR